MSLGAYERAVAYFEALRNAWDEEVALLSGAWSSKVQRTYASASQLGTGEGPFVDVVDWRWDGTFEATSPLVGVALLADDRGVHWVKSNPAVDRPTVGVSMSGWRGAGEAVSAGGSFHGCGLPSVCVQADEDPRRSCALGPSSATTGVPHVVARWGPAFFLVVLVPSGSIRLGAIDSGVCATTSRRRFLRTFTS